MSEYKHIYNSKAWKDLRIERLVNEPLCRICKSVNHIRPAKHVDHIVPMSKGGAPLDYDNTQSLCLEHHSLKTAQDEGNNPNWGCGQDGTPADPKHHWNSR